MFDRFALVFITAGVRNFALGRSFSASTSVARWRRFHAIFGCSTARAGLRVINTIWRDLATRRNYRNKFRDAQLGTTMAEDAHEPFLRYDRRVSTRPKLGRISLTPSPHSPRAPHAVNAHDWLSEYMLRRKSDCEANVARAISESGADEAFLSAQCHRSDVRPVP